MPNYVYNTVNIDGGFDGLDLFTDEHFDFNKIIPMPDELNIERGSINSVGMYFLWKKTKDNIKKGIDTTKNAILLNNIEEVFEKTHSYMGNIKDIESRTTWYDTEEKKENALKNGENYVNNYMKYGHSTWYEWRINNWNTKWNAMETHITDEAVYFTTAWSPPVNVIKKLSEMVQGRYVYLNYEGEIDPYGDLKFFNGELVEENYYMEDYPELDDDCDDDEK